MCFFLLSFSPYWRLLTKLNKQNAGGRHHLLAVGSHALEVARVSGVKVSDAQPGAVVGGPEGDPPGLLHHGCVVLEPADGRRWVSRDPAVQLGCLTQGRGDIIHGFIQVQVRICEHREKEVSKSGADQGPLRME